MQHTPLIPEDLATTVAEYQRLWPLMTSLQMNISKLAGKDAIRACAKRLRMLSKQGDKQGVHFEHELEADAFLDYLIYMHRPRGISLVRQMLNRNRYPQGSDQRQLLERMVQARFSLFLIKEVVENGGFIAQDIIRGGEFFILNQSLPEQNTVGFLSGIRIFPYENVWMHTGASLTLGTIDEDSGLQPMERILNETEERELNESTIVRWRAVTRETAERDGLSL